MVFDRPARGAWAVLALCFTLALLGRGMGETFTVFLLPISGTFGWARADVISIYALAALSMGLSSPFVGRLFDFSGPRIVYGLGLLLLGTGVSAAAFATSLWQLQLSMGFAVGLGMACLSNVPSSLLLGRWFGTRLPTAMAVVYSANGAGILTLVPLSQILIDHSGWRNSYHLLGGFLLVLLIPLLLLPWRRIARERARAPAKATTTAPADADIEWTLPRAVRHHAFWALFCTFFFTAIGVYSIGAQVVAYLIEAGFPPLQAASAWGLSGVVLVIGMLTVSWLDGLIGRRRAILFSYGLTTLGIAFLWLLGRYPSLWLLGGFLLCFGSTIGSRGPLITAAAINIFHGRRVGTIFGTISIGSGLGAALGAPAGGLLHDWSHSYDPVIAFALVNVLIGMIPFLTVRALRE
ncbi:MAG: MFS transporter [Xanthobacteraceae bacterium]|nr:MFS transporter [Xanthobacteraceae bacterium]